MKQARTTKVLPLRECGLRALPDGSTELAANVRTIDICCNSIKALPDEIRAWSSLETLLCSQNGLTSLPSSIGSLGQLQKLDLSFNRLSTLPPELSQLGKVKTLMLNGNKLGPSLPSAVFEGPLAQSLEELDLSVNQLQDLPQAMSALVVLRTLSVSQNALTSLPAFVGKLEKLVRIDASLNRIKFVDPAVIALPQMNELWLKGNPMDRLELEDTPGFEDFLTRRKQRIDARIDANVAGHIDLAVCGLD